MHKNNDNISSLDDAENDDILHSDENKSENVEETSKKASKKKIKPFWFVSSFAIVVIFLLAIGYYFNRNVQIEQIKFEQGKYVKSEFVHKVMEPAIGQFADSLDVAKFVLELEKNSAVKSAALSIQPDGDLVVYIKERKALALVVNGSNMKYVDEDGVFLPEAMGEHPNVPLVYGYPVKKEGAKLDSAQFVGVSNFLNSIDKRPLSKSTISEVVLTKDDGVVALSTDNGVKLLFGFSSFDQKLKNWEAFYTQVIKKKSMDAFTEIDLRFSNQVITKEI